MEKHFDVSRVIGIELNCIRETGYKWLPRKQKTFFFGLIRRNSWHEEGYYQNGYYEECYESGCWDAHNYSAESLRGYGYIVDDISKTVYSKPRVTVFLENNYKVYKNFDSDSEAYEWVSDLRKKTGKQFLK